jgi:hypothetical protein
MTQSMCVSGCQTRGFKFAGLQHGTQCHCANELNAASPNWRAPESECSAKCGGDASQKCGGSWRMGVYAVDLAPVSSSSSRTASASATSVSSSLSTSVSSTTSSRSSAIASSSSSPPSSSSSSGTLSRSTSSAQSSSSSRSTSIASTTSAASSSSSSSTVSTTSMAPSPSASTSSTAASASASASSTIANDYIGCFVDQNPRSLRNYTYWTNDMTPQKCRDTCKSRGFEVSGTSNAKECFCGEAPPISKKVADTECSSVCAGDKDTKCGGWWRLSVYGEGGQARWASASGSAAATGAAPRRRSRVRT